MNVTRKLSLLRVARGDEPADILLTNAKIVNTYSYDIEQGHVAISDGHIAGIGDYQARQVIDLKGAYLVPSLIDGHIHIESSLLAPAEFARAVIRCGTGAVICDPHEIANVCGLAGIQYMLDATKDIPLDVYVMLPSCVPATNMETSGAILCAKDLKGFLSNPRVLGLAEVMNFPGVVLGDEAVHEKIEIAEDRPIDGHAPGLQGHWLNAYAAAGIHTDHECTTRAEAEEKLRRGMFILIREGLTAKNLTELLELVTPHNAHRFAFVSDDRHADDILSEGHLNATLRKAVAKGLNPVVAVAMASTHTASIFRLRDTGAITPGRRANFAVFEDLKSFKAVQVWRDGEVIADADRVIVDVPVFSPKTVMNTVKLEPLTEGAFAVPATAKSCLVIEIIPDQIVTGKITAHLPVENGHWQADVKQDISKLVVIERYGHGGSMGKAFARGFNLKNGALASTVAHDSHNLICAGMNDRDMTVAANTLITCGGGWVVVADGEVKALLPLPIAGLMSDQPAAFVVEHVMKLHKAARDLGCTLSAPFMALSFLALPVIPHLKLTDKGLFDVDSFQPVKLAVAD